jgi:transposase InsO family protein
LALVVLSVVEQRLDAVRAVLANGSPGEVAAQVGVSRQTLHTWTTRYLTEGVAGLADRSHRPKSCPHQVSTAIEVAVAELRRAHPRWGAKRIRMELLRKPVDGVTVPSVATINRILARQGLVQPRPRKRPRDSYVRFERPGPMQLWQIDIVSGVMIVNPTTGELREAKVVTGVDDHSRFCVIAKVVERATARAVCLAFAEALVKHGVPDEVITDNGKQFTDRFGRHGTRNGEVLFDKICRKNAVTHRLTQPASPNQNGKVERFHGTLRPDFLETAGPFTCIEEAQAALDAWIAAYNAERPHQALDAKLPVTPAERFTPAPEQQRALVDLWLPPALEPAAPTATEDPKPAVPAPQPEQTGWSGGPVEFDLVVPPSGNMQVAGKQFWLGPARAGQVVRFWAGTDVIHLSIAGARVKSVRSHLTVADLARLVASGAEDAGPPPLPATESGEAIEVDRVVSSSGTIALGGKILLAAEILAGRKVGIRIEATTLLLFDLESRELLRTRANPLTPEQVLRLRGLRPAGPTPRPASEPIRVQRLADHTGMISICGQRIGLGRGYARRTLTIAVSETTLAVELDDGDVRVIRRTTTQPVRNIKSRLPRTATSIS